MIMMMILVDDNFVLRKWHMPHFLPNSREIFTKNKFCNLHSSHFTLFFPANVKTCYVAIDSLIVIIIKN